MKKFGIVATAALAVALVVGVAWFFLHAGSGVKVADSLSAADTVAIVTLEDLCGWTGEFDRVGQTLPSQMKDSTPMAFDANKRSEFLGFDPAKPDGWQQIGIDPKAGAAILIDARLAGGKGGTPLPMLLLHIDDPKKLADFLSKKLGKPVDFSQSKDGVRESDVMGQKVFSVHLGDWRGFVLPELYEAGPDALRKVLQTMRADSSPRLSADNAFTTAMKELPKGARFAAYAHADGALAYLRQQKRGVATGEHLAKLFRAAVIWGGLSENGARIVATPEGVKALQQVFAPEGKSPEFSRQIPKADWAAVRISLNLKDMFDGAIALLPPDMGSARTGIASARLGFTLLTGMGWDEITQAISGRAVVALDTKYVAALVDGSRDALPQWRALLAVRDPAKADALLENLIQIAKKRGVDPIAAKVGDQKAWQFKFGPAAAVVARIGEFIVVASDVAGAEAAAKLDKGASVAATPMADAVDGEVIAGYCADFSGLLAENSAFRKKIQQESPQTLNLWPKDAAKQISSHIDLDRVGIVWKMGGDASNSSSVAAVLAAAAIPAFTRYADRAKAVQIQPDPAAAPAP